MSLSFAPSSWPACTAPRCARPAETAGYCCRHYAQVRRHGRLTPEREYDHRPAQCIVPGCGGRVQARGWCWRHLRQVYRHGHVQERQTAGTRIELE